MDNKNRFLPVSRADMEAQGLQELDFLFISGDAYVDHPSFGVAIITRLLEKEGYKVGIIAQPDWRSTDDFKKMGRPRLGVLVSAGNLDSLLNKYTAAKKPRSQDSYAPGGKAGLRPDRATIVYCQRIRELWKKTPLIIGGIEASLRRFAHYDYWSDSVRRSILIDSKADLLIYGMGERQIKEIAAALAAGEPIESLKNIPGMVSRVTSLSDRTGYVEVPSFEAVKESKGAFAAAFKTEYLEQDAVYGKPILQKHGTEYICQNRPALPLTPPELDEIYELSYTRTYHPMYEAAGGVPAIEEIKFSLVSQRGCFGGCSFCALFAHQGRVIQPRSQESLLREAKILTSLPDFKGYIHDVGGPTANFRRPACEKQSEKGVCRGKQCLFPKPCRNLAKGHGDYLNLLRSLRKLPGIKKVFVRSGLRYDYLLTTGDKEFLRELCEHHVSGQLKVAPEHVAAKVTNLMGKQGKEAYLKFKR
ncbi:MAG: YgiQ family radical SAM protein, partial [Sporomusaceae bacterium]|nr:YgiQ family radical SAM protein [Sporomusaceae bacterium]